MTATVTHDTGNQAIIPGNSKRTELVIQNDNPEPIWLRWRGEVSKTDPALAGIRLLPFGAIITLFGNAASQSVFAVHGLGVGVTRDVAYETDVEV
jgi:hypothetical protein